jgi:predicted DNA-binding transcriptional regulator YafY
MIYEPAFADQARHLCRLGATDEELAEHFEVCVRTLYRWRNTHEAFATACVISREHADDRVEMSLYSERSALIRVGPARLRQTLCDPYADWRVSLSNPYGRSAHVLPFCR